MIIDLGAGPWPKHDATVKVDVNKWRDDYLIHDLSKVPYPFESNVATKIYFGDVIEHLSEFIVDVVLS